MSKLLTEQDFQDAAALLNVPVNTIKAVSKVEQSGSDGFDANGNPDVLFERHHFARLTKNKYNSSHSDISNFKSGGYTKNEWSRMNKAAQLDKEAAYKSTSWGKFQIMGFNHSLCGYDDVFSFVVAMKESEGKHLLAFTKFIINSKIDAHLRSGDFDRFAKLYNGPKCSKNRYAQRIQDAVRQFDLADNSVVTKSTKRVSTKEIQLLLKNKGYNPGTVDGVMGKLTKKAIVEFQRKNSIKGTLTNSELYGHLTA